MNQYTCKDFIKLLKKNSQSIRHNLLEEGTDCMRVYDRHQADFPVTVDLYADYARVVDYGEEPLDEQTKSFCIDSIARMLYVPEQNIVYSYRAKRQGKEQHGKADASVRVIVKEGGLEFETELASYTDTGLFLDHYRTRQMVREMSAGLDVLNLFSYTGSFSVYAASGLAKSVTSVDLSSTYTKWAEENLKRNGYSGNNYQCICSDASKYIRCCAQEGTKFDLIIFDPPSFSNSHKMDEDFDVGRDGIDWIRRLAGILRKDGVILFSTNLGSFRMDKRRLRGFSVCEITDRVMAPGFVKNRKGAVRSWIMTVDDDALKLDWSDDGFRQKKEHVKEYGKNEYKPGRRYSSDRRPSRDRNFRERGERSDSRGHRRESRGPGEYGKKEFDREERRPRYSDSYSDRPKRNYGPKHTGFDRNNRDDRRPSRDFRRNDERPKYASNERRSSGPKPYGYDSFKPARSRNDDDPDLFWN